MVATFCQRFLYWDSTLGMLDESLNQTNLKCFVGDKIAVAKAEICLFEAMEDSSPSIELDDFESLQGTAKPFLIGK